MIFRIFISSIENIKFDFEWQKKGKDFKLIFLFNNHFKVLIERKNLCWLDRSLYKVVRKIWSYLHNPDMSIFISVPDQLLIYQNVFFWLNLLNQQTIWKYFVFIAHSTKIKLLNLTCGADGNRWERNLILRHLCDRFLQGSLSPTIQGFCNLLYSN